MTPAVKLPPAWLTPVENLPSVCNVNTGCKFNAGVTATNVDLSKDVTAGVNGTGGKFFAGINVTGC
jgi:hypothetical protein